MHQSHTGIECNQEQFARFRHRSQIRFAFRHGHGLVRQDAKTQLRALA